MTDEPRSTVRASGVALEHHLSLLPPDTEPLTALAAISLLLHGVEPVAGRFSARLGTAAADDSSVTASAASPVMPATSRVANLTMAALQSTSADSVAAVSEHVGIT